MESHTTNQSTSTHLGLDELKSKYEDVVKNTIVKTNNGGSASLNTNFHHTKKEKELHVEDSEGFEAHRSESQIHLIHT
jgi:hypothetical protein